MKRLQAFLRRMSREVKVIEGCEAQGDLGVPYMTRYILFRTSFGGLYVHVFHRSDNDRARHDHPWNFVSMILWRGYVEDRPGDRKRYYPGALLFRPATWIHRVELLRDCNGAELPAVTLVWTTSKIRVWGFHVPDGWVEWREFFRTNGCK
jgi:hypothetical protein